MPAAVYFEEGYRGVTVDFVTWRMEKGAFCTMASESLERGEITETELADMDSVCGGETGRVGREIPRLHFESAHLNTVEISHTRDFGLVLGHATTRAKLLDFFFT